MYSGSTCNFLLGPLGPCSALKICWLRSGSRVEDCACGLKSFGGSWVTVVYGRVYGSGFRAWDYMTMQFRLRLCLSSSIDILWHHHYCRYFYYSLAECTTRASSQVVKAIVVKKTNILEIATKEAMIPNRNEHKLSQVQLAQTKHHGHCHHGT